MDIDEVKKMIASGEEVFLIEADLADADLRNANLTCANLTNTDLRNADLRGADLTGANLKGADLKGANLRNADLRGANLTNADLTGANLKGVKTSYYTFGFHLACPEEGSFVAFKKASKKIVVLEIPADAKRSSATTLKCRCNKAKVLRIENLDGSISDLNQVASDSDPTFIYKIGEMVQTEYFDEDRWNECSGGIHFFLNKQNAVDYTV